MAELPDDGDRGELWRVRVPVVFDIAARSWRQARGIVDQTLTSRSIGALSVPEGREGVRGWSHQEDSYPGLNTSASTQQTFLADLTTIEVLRTLVETEAQQPGTLRVLNAAELQQLRITLAAADRYVEIPNPEYPESDPLFAGHATEAAPELPEGLYEGMDIGGKPVRLAVGPSRLNALGRTAATLPLGNVDSRALAEIAGVLQGYDRTQHPSAALEQISNLVRAAGHDGLDSRELLANRAARTRPQIVTVGVITWSDDPEVEPSILLGSRRTDLARRVATQLYEELEDSEAFAGGREFIDQHTPIEQWNTPRDVDQWLEALAEATPIPRVTITQLPVTDLTGPGGQYERDLSYALARRAAQLAASEVTQPRPGAAPARELRPI